MAKSCLTILLSCLFLLPAQIFAATSLPEVKVFKDWAVGCNNLRHCEGLSFILPDWEGGGDKEYEAVVKFSRGAKANAKPVFELILGMFGDMPAGLAGQQVTVGAGEQSLKLGVFPAGDKDSVTIPANLTQQFIALLRQFDELTISIEGQSYKASLRGSSAGLLYADEQQKRIGTSTALVRRGQRKMTAAAPRVNAIKVKKPPAQMTIPDGLTSRARRELAPSFRECSGDGNASLDFAKPLDNQHYLVAINCWLAAYNSGSLLYKVNANSVTKAKLEVSPLKIDLNKATQGDNEVSGVDFTAKTGILSSYNKGRGLGDCGTYAEWAWDGQSFALVRFDEMPECRGVPEFLNVWDVPVR